MRKTYLLLLFALFSVEIFSHPHVFISTELKVCFNDQGMRGIEVKYVYAEMFTHELKQMYDVNKNEKFDENEVRVIKASAFSNLINYDYFVHVMFDNKKVKSTDVTDFKAYIEDGSAVYSFFLVNEIEFSSVPKVLKIAPYDHTYFIDVTLDEKKVEFEENTNIAYKFETFADKSQSYYYDQITPECVKLTVNRK